MRTILVLTLRDLDYFAFEEISPYLGDFRFEGLLRLRSGACSSSGHCELVRPTRSGLMENDATIFGFLNDWKFLLRQHLENAGRVGPPTPFFGMI